MTLPPTLVTLETTRRSGRREAAEPSRDINSDSSTAATQQQTMIEGTITMERRTDDQGPTTVDTHAPVDGWSQRHQPNARPNKPQTTILYIQWH